MTVVNGREWVAIDGGIKTVNGGVITIDGGIKRQWVPSSNVVALPTLIDISNTVVTTVMRQQ